MTDRIAFTLRHPILITEFGGETAKETRIAELSLARRIKGRHMRAMDGANGPVQAKLWLIAALAGISRDEADELDEEDIIAITALYDGDGHPFAPATA